MSKRIVLPAILFLAAAAVAPAAESVSALQAVKALPKTVSKSFAGVVGRAGSPAPKQWLVLVNDATAASGVREFTVAKGVVLSTKEGSDFATELTPEQRIDAAKVRVDSDMAADLAASYAAANNQVPAAFDFDLHQAGQGAAPLWSVTALDNAGAKLGTLVIAATNGTVVSHEGFATEPSPADLTAELSPAPTESTGEKKTTKSSSSSSEGKKRPGTFHRIGGHLEKFFTGKNTIGK